MVWLDLVITFAGNIYEVGLLHCHGCGLVLERFVLMGSAPFHLDILSCPQKTRNLSSESEDVRESQSNFFQLKLWKKI